MSRIVYHGRSPSDDSWDASTFGRIDGQSIRIYEVEMPEPEEAKQYRARDLYDLPGQVINEYDAKVTGGLTAHLGAAYKFHQSLSEIGAVFLIDYDRLSAKPVKIQYDYEWASDHPGTYARIDSIDQFEIYQHDELYGAGYYQNESGVPIVNKWRNRMEQRLNSFAYEDEAELAVYGEDFINFGDALVGTASYMHTTSHIGGSVQAALAKYPGFTMAYAGANEENVKRASNEERAKWFQRVFVDTYGDTGVIDNDHMVVLYDEDELSVRDETTRIPDEAFILATDGQTVYRAPSQVDKYLGDNGGFNV